VAEKAGNYSLADKLFVKVGDRLSPRAWFQALHPPCIKEM
jgi:hypothetical protein